jgi:subtilisin family serine protease
LLRKRTNPEKESLFRVCFTCTIISSNQIFLEEEMHNRSVFRVTGIILIMGLLLSMTAPSTTIAQAPEPQASVTVDTEVLDEIESNGSASYWINFRARTDLSKAYPMSWSDRGWFVYDELTKTASASQDKVVQYLVDAKVIYKTYWIKNTILVKDSNIDTLNALMSFPEIESITAPKSYILYEPDTSNAITGNIINAIEPNLLHINADDAWALGYTGTGLVVANIDTGVRYTHQALVNHYRGSLGGGTYNHDYN